MAVTVWTALSSAGVRTERSATMSAEPAHAHLDSRGHSVKKVRFCLFFFSINFMCQKMLIILSDF